MARKPLIFYMTVLLCLFAFCSGQLVSAEIPVAAPYFADGFDRVSELENWTVNANGALAWDTETPSPSGQADGVAKLTTEGSAVTGSMSRKTTIDLDVPVILEAKLNFAAAGNEKHVFILKDGSASAKALAVFNDGTIRNNDKTVKFKEGTKANPAYALGVWHHAYFIFSGSSYDFYFDGEKLTPEPVPILGQSSLSAITDLVLSTKVWGREDVYYDDVIAQPLGEGMELQTTSLGSGVDVPVTAKRILLDFTTLADPESLAEVTIQTGADHAEATGYTCELDPYDTSKIWITFEQDLEFGTDYEIDCSGLRDMRGAGLPQPVIRFQTLSAPKAPALIGSVPENGAQNVSCQTELALQFDEPISAESFLPACAALDPPDAEVTTVTLSQDGKTAVLNLSDLLVLDREYEVILSPEIESATGIPIDLEAGLPVSFRTQGTLPADVDELNEITEGKNNLIFVTKKPDGSNAFRLDKSAPEKFCGDAVRAVPTAGMVSELVYELESGIRNARVELFLGTKNLASLTYSSSADGEHFIPVVPAESQSAEKPGDIGFLLYYHDFLELPEGTRYFKIAADASASDTEPWGTKLKSVSLNPAPAAYTGVVSSSPSDGETHAESTEQLTVVFDTPVRRTGVDESRFLINGAAAARAVLGDDYRTVTIEPAEPLGFDREYTLSIGPGLEDVYGRAVPEKSIRFRTGRELEWKAAVLRLDGSGVDAGNLTPGNYTAEFTVINRKQGVNTGAFLAVVYSGSRTKAIHCVTKEDLAFGEQTVTLSGIQLGEDDTGIQLLLWNNLRELKPIGFRVYQ